MYKLKISIDVIFSMMGTICWNDTKKWPQLCLKVEKISPKFYTDGIIFKIEVRRA